MRQEEEAALVKLKSSGDGSDLGAGVDIQKLLSRHRFVLFKVGKSGGACEDFSALMPHAHGVSGDSPSGQSVH